MQPKTPKKPFLSLVGAGIGDADLITLKAIKTLKNADVVLYDALINEELLEYAPLKSPKISVGKRFGKHSATQAEINELIVTMAWKYGHVVRLKGGDPFIFGRGGEEIQYAQNFGIEAQVIAGISSALAAPALQGIPLTCRNISESFWVITGTTQHQKLSQDLHFALQSSATIVILMGMHRLTEIIQLFQDAQKAELPVAIIQNASLPNEKIVVGTMSNIVAKVKENGLSSPAVIVAGETVRFHQRFEYQQINSEKNSWLVTY